MVHFEILPYCIKIFSDITFLSEFFIFTTNVLLWRFNFYILNPRAFNQEQKLILICDKKGTCPII